MRRSVALLLLPALLVLSGCFQVFSTLTVRPDGSAQLVERITAEGAMAMGLMGMNDLTSGTSSFETRAVSLGEGVELVSVEEEVVPGAITYVVTYNVADVNALVYSFSDAVDPDAVGESIMGGGMTEEPSMADGEDEGMDMDEGEPPYRFAFTPGQTATLEVIVPEGGAGPGEFDTSRMGGGETDEENYKQALVLLGTMAMHFEVAVDGELVSADRGWAEDNTVTLSSIQMGELMTYARDEITDGNVDDYIARQDPTVDLDLPGLRTVAPGTVTVRFR